MAFADCTYSISRTVMTMERTTRAKAGVKQIPMAIIQLRRPEPRAAVMASARIMVGRDQMASIAAVITRSMAPP